MVGKLWAPAWGRGRPGDTISRVPRQTPHRCAYLACLPFSHSGHEDRIKTCSAAASFPPVCICTWSRGRRIDAPAAGRLTLALTCHGKQIEPHRPGPSPPAFHRRRCKEGRHLQGSACGPQPETSSTRVSCHEHDEGARSSPSHRGWLQKLLSSRTAGGEHN